MGPSSGSLYNKYDKVNLNRNMDPYYGATRLYYKSFRKIVPCVMMKNYNIVKYWKY
jgi:hypothetical protein